LHSDFGDKSRPPEVKRKFMKLTKYDIPVAIVVKFIVTGHSNESTRASTEGIEYLSGGVTPYPGVAQPGEVGLYVVQDTASSSWQGHSTDEKDRQHDVRENGSEVDDLAKGLDALE
jgi:hypothetical protein